MAFHFFEVLLHLNWQVYSCSNCMFAFLQQLPHGVQQYTRFMGSIVILDTWHHLTFHSINALSVWISLVCLLGSVVGGCNKSSANFLCCSYRTLVVTLITRVWRLSAMKEKLWLRELHIIPEIFLRQFVLVLKCSI